MDNIFNNRVTKMIGVNLPNLLTGPQQQYPLSTKRPCRYCDNDVTTKDGLQCKGACERWAHFKCLGFTPQMMIDARAGKLEVMCPCPHCKFKKYDEDVHKEYKCTPINGVCPETPELAHRFNKVSACDDPPQWLIDLDKCDAKTCDPPCRFRKIACIAERQPRATVTTATAATAPTAAAAVGAENPPASLSRKPSATGSTKVSRKISFHDNTVKTEEIITTETITEKYTVKETLPPTSTPPKSPPMKSPKSASPVPPTAPPKPVNETAINVNLTGLDRQTSVTNVGGSNLPCHRPVPCGPYSTCGRMPPCDGLAPCGKHDYPCSKRRELLAKRPYKYKDYKYKAETTKCVKPPLSRTPSKVSLRSEASKGLICDSPACRDASCLPHSTCGTSPIFNEPIPPSDQFCNKNYKSPPMVLGYHPKPEVAKKSQQVVGLISEDAPCRNCRCIIGSTLSDFKCVSKMCTVRNPSGLKSATTCTDNRNRSCSCLRVTVDPMSVRAIGSASDSKLTKPGQCPKGSVRKALTCVRKDRPALLEGRSKSIYTPRQ